jgi:hypothetical protein
VTIDLYYLVPVEFGKPFRAGEIACSEFGLNLDEGFAGFVEFCDFGFQFFYEGFFVGVNLLEFGDCLGALCDLGAFLGYLDDGFGCAQLHHRVSVAHQIEDGIRGFLGVGGKPVRDHIEVLAFGQAVFLLEFRSLHPASQGPDDYTGSLGGRDHGFTLHKVRNNGPVFGVDGVGVRNLVTVCIPCRRDAESRARFCPHSLLVSHLQIPFLRGLTPRGRQQRTNV